MVKKLIVAIGDYGGGKTTFAKWYAKNKGGLFIDFELLYFEKQENDRDRFDVFVKRLASTLQKSSKHLFVMDGYKAITGSYEELADPTFAYLRNNIHCDIQLCLCFAAPHIVRKRQEVKADYVNDAIPRDESEIKRIAYSLFGLAVTMDSDPLFMDTTDGFHFISREEWPQRWEELILLSDLDKMPHDKYYQDIELPSGLVIPGYSQPHESWIRLRDVIDFKDKDVLDLGCFHGFFCFKAEDVGARDIVGIEINENAVGVARRIAWLKNSRVHFYQGDIASLKTDHVYDIVLVLNMMHHVKDIHQALKNIFDAGKLIVFEIPLTQEDIVSQYAEQFGFDFAGKVNSHRADREIVIFTNPQTGALPPQIPSAYRYNYNMEYSKKLVRRAVVLASKIKILFPLVWLVRKYRGLRKSTAHSLIRYSSSKKSLDRSK
ncbi:class I SAM-dependent methyltransferase [Chloroflexota bacterium]